ncbi:hypothetical protein EHP00_1169 [Ecytonucleospora hepatopenaei]|uniref:Uncharacterized protein n=1 Tax=Ecytonucleospora hepatopenaei TaxID=646526 RepID=A0A1W0E4H5_9MICR|nr:hypothetical protein EHP00_1169 [Ecytonucleospora hepatopenaei]
MLFSFYFNFLRSVKIQTFSSAFVNSLKTKGNFLVPKYEDGSEYRLSENNPITHKNLYGTNDMFIVHVESREVKVNDLLISELSRKNYNVNPPKRISLYERSEVSYKYDLNRDEILVIKNIEDDKYKNIVLINSNLCWTEEGGQVIFEKCKGIDAQKFLLVDTPENAAVDSKKDLKPILETENDEHKTSKNNYIYLDNTDSEFITDDTSSKLQDVPDKKEEKISLSDKEYERYENNRKIIEEEMIRKQEENEKRDKDEFFNEKQKEEELLDKITGK